MIHKHIEGATLEFNAPDTWYRHMQASTDYLGIEQMQPGMAYSIWARNAYVGIWLPDDRGFLISRYKFSPPPYLFVEYHWDKGEPFGTAKPLRLLEMCPLSMPPETEYLDGQQSAAMCSWLDDLESRYPPIPGWDSVGERRQAVAAWERKRAKQTEQSAQRAIQSNRTESD